MSVSQENSRADTDRRGELLVGTLPDFRETGARRVVTSDADEIVIFRIGDDLVAFENRCPHQGGPIALGVIAPSVEAEVTSGGGVVERLSADELRLVCPWHAWEFDPRTGRCTADPRTGLRRYEVVVRGEDVYVRTEAKQRDSR